MLYNAQLDDEGFYYYNVELASGGYDRGRDYEIQVLISGKSHFRI